MSVPSCLPESISCLYHDSNFVLGSTTNMLCSCEPQCATYRDCCLDHSNPCPLQNRSRLYQSPNEDQCKHHQVDNWIKQKLQAIRYNPSSMLPFTCVQQVPMIARCPLDWQDNYFRVKCENISDPFDFYTHVPVSNPASSLTYRNIYCAYCHQVNITDIHYWNITIYCSGSENLKLPFTLQQNGLWKYCSLLTLNRPTISSRHRCQDFNISLISSCMLTPMALQWNQTYYKTIEEGCRNYHAPVLSNNQLYRNPFCLLCSTKHLLLNHSIICTSLGLIEGQILDGTPDPLIGGKSLQVDPPSPTDGELFEGELLGTGRNRRTLKRIAYSFSYDPSTHTMTFQAIGSNPIRFSVVPRCRNRWLYNPWRNQCQDIFFKPILPSTVHPVMANLTQCRIVDGNINTTAYINVSHVIWKASNKIYLAVGVYDNFSFYNCTQASNSSTNQTVSKPIRNSILHYAPAIISVIAFMLQIYYHFHRKLICRWSVACWSVTVILLQIAIVVHYSIPASPSISLSIADCDLILALSHFLELATCMWTVVIAVDILYRSRHGDFLHHASFECSLFGFILLAWILPAAIIGCLIVLNKFSAAQSERKYSTIVTTQSYRNCHVLDTNILLWFSFIPYCLATSICCILYLTALMIRTRYHRRRKETPPEEAIIDNNRFSEYQKILLLMLISIMVDSGLIIRSMTTISANTSRYLQYIAIGVHFVQGFVVGCSSFFI